MFFTTQHIIFTKFFRVFIEFKPSVKETYEYPGGLTRLTSMTYYRGFFYQYIENINMLLYHTSISIVTFDVWGKTTFYYRQTFSWHGWKTTVKCKNKKSYLFIFTCIYY